MRNTKMMWLGSMALMGLLAPNMVRADVDPAAELKALADTFNAGVKAAQDKKEEPDVKALRKAMTDKAKADVKGVDPMKVDPAKAMDWGQLFSRAQEPKKTIQVMQHLLTTNPEAKVKFSAQMMLIESYDETKDANGIIKTLKDVKLSDPAMAGQLVGETTGVLDTVTDKKGPKQSLEVLKEVEAQLPMDQFKAPMADSIIFQIADTRAKLLDKAGKRGEAMTALADAKKRLSPNSRLEKAFTRTANYISVIGSPAPVLKDERGYGDFTSLDAYKGKVVVLDFMAHWCGPCKSSLPEMKKMYSELHDQGLEVVSITSYYGFFDKEQKITPDTEYARMEGFMAKYGMTWSLIFGDDSNSENYGVNGIPHFVIIDREGRVNSILVGYSPEQHAKLRKTVEGLLNKQFAAN